MQLRLDFLWKKKDLITQGLSSGMKQFQFTGSNTVILRNNSSLHKVVQC